MTKQSIPNVVLLLAYVLALVASLNHVAWAFSTLEFIGQGWTGWLAALAVDAGLAALAYAIQQRRRVKRPVWTLWLGVSLFALISAFANLLHALTVQIDGAAITLSTFGQVDVLTLVKAVVLSATLPLLVVYLGEIVSSDDAEASRVVEQERKQTERRERRTVQVDADLIQDIPARSAEPASLPPGGQVEPVKSLSNGLHDASRQLSTSAGTSVLDAINASKQVSKGEKMETLLIYLGQNSNASLAEAGQAIGVSKSTVGNYVDELAEGGRLTKNGHGWEVIR